MSRLYILFCLLLMLIAIPMKAQQPQYQQDAQRSQYGQDAQQWQYQQTEDQQYTDWVDDVEPRHPLLAVKTNILMDAAWMPQYGFCPLPNLDVELFPKRGHWTVGVTFDMPWWQSSAYNDKTRWSTGKDHKFFQARHYQIYTRWYSREDETDGAYNGFYLQPYVNLAVYGIGFRADKGWQGEGVGGGFGIGYKQPLGKKWVDGVRHTGHWFLEFGAQIGYFYTKYDPYIFGNPKTGNVDGHYYYRYTGENYLFHKRLHHRNYFGLTRVGVTIGYNLFWHKRTAARYLSE